MSYDVIVIGGGTSELVLACYLAQAKKRVLVLEAADETGGTAGLRAFAPGFRVETCQGSSGWLAPKIVRDLELAAHGYEAFSPDETVFVARPEGSLLLSQDARASREAIARLSSADAGKWDAFGKRMAHLAGFLETLYLAEPPKLMSSGAGDMMQLMGLGLRLRRLGKVDMIELLRTLPMSMADLLDDWFETDALKVAVASGAIVNLLQGPRSQGTCFNMLHHQVGRPVGAFRARNVARGERGHLAVALAARAKKLGVEIRTGVPARIVVADGRATGVELAAGEKLESRAVVSGADPRRTFMDLMDPTELGPEFLRAVSNVKFRGIRAFVNLALAELPKFTNAPDGDAHLRAIVTTSGALDDLERAYDDAKHGRVSKNLHLEATIPSLFDDSLAPAGKHVMNVAVQFVPHAPKGAAWDGAAKERLADQVVETLARVAPNLKNAVVARDVTTPKDIESTYGLTQGHLYGGELTLDQILFMRPLPGSAHYTTPIDGLFMCGESTHPGGGLPGLSGANAARAVLAR